MMPNPKDETTPRCDESQVKRMLKKEGGGRALVGQSVETEAEGDSIDRLIQECEQKGLEQRGKKARKGGEDGGPGRMSRSEHPESVSLPAGPGLAAERAVLGFGWRELLTDSQCQHRFAEHWGSPMSDEPTLVEREAEHEDPSQVHGGDSCRENRQEWTEDGLDSSVRLAFEPCRIELEQCCQKKGLVFAELGEVLSRALAVVEDKTERCSQPKGDLGLPGPSQPSTDALIRALNSLYGTKTKVRTKEDNIRRQLTERLHSVVSKSNLLGEALPQLDFHRLFQTKTVDYSGEEVQVARSFQWKMVEAAMPDAVGSLELDGLRQSWWSRATGPRSARGC